MLYQLTSSLEDGNGGYRMDTHGVFTSLTTGHLAVEKLWKCIFADRQPFVCEKEQIFWRVSRFEYITLCPVTPDEFTGL